MKFSPFFKELNGKSYDYIYDELTKNPQKFKEEIDLYSKELYGSKIYSKINCPVLIDSFNIMSDGSLVPCCNFTSQPEVKMGNVLNNSISEIWNSKKYSDFRKKDNLPVHSKCLSCKENMEYI